MKQKNLFSIIGALGLMLSAVVTVGGCRQNHQPEQAVTVPVTGVSFEKTELNLFFGESVQLNAIIAPANATNKGVTWASDTASVATVDEKGTLTAVADGTAKITVTTKDGSFTAECTVTVEKKAVIELPAGVTTITIEALSANGDPITVEGCAETSLTSNTSTTLHVTGSSFVLKGDITDLSCDNGNITNLDVRGLPNLNMLSCDTSHVKSLNVQGLTKLNTLSCGNNELESLDLSGLSALTGVDCQNNKLKILNLAGTTMLTAVYATKNELESLDLKDCVELTELYCNSNKLTALDVKTATKLKVFDCSSNNLSQDAFKKLFESLPQREVGDNATCLIYTEEADVTEGNYKTFTEDELKVAKDKNWKVHKTSTSNVEEAL